jgi:hypothetical protein
MYSVATSASIETAKSSFFLRRNGCTSHEVAFTNSWDNNNIRVPACALPGEPNFSATYISSDEPDDRRPAYLYVHGVCTLGAGPGLGRP